MRTNIWGAAVLTALALSACSSDNSDGRTPPPPLVMPAIGGGGSTPSTSAAGAGEIDSLDAGMSGGAAGEGDTDPASAGAAGEAGAPSVVLPRECPGVLGDYSILFGEDGGEMFTDLQLEGRVLVFGGAGDDTFLASPPGAGDCLLGGEGNDRFETDYLSAPSVFVGGAGDDVFVVRGSAGSDTAYISDFQSSGRDRILFDAMAYGLTFTQGAPLSSEVVSVPGFIGGNSTATASARILYNPEDGGLWYDSDANGEVAEAVQIAVIENYASYRFHLNDFSLE